MSTHRTPLRHGPEASPHRGVAARLLRDRTANTLVIMAMAMIPISALAGSAIDMGRLYVVKGRLQQACDAGVLAGRKFMSTTSGSSTLDGTATARANTFFANNFRAGWLESATPTFVPVKTADQQVQATASVKVPMTIMKMFAAPDVTINVACKARYDVSDTDVIFVLDTTGSMACKPEDSETACSTYVGANPAQQYTRPSSDPDAMPGYLGTTTFGVPETTAGNGSRIKALRQAVKDFYATMAANIDSNTRVRYGFVTYTSTVNVGKAIYAVNPAYLMGGIGAAEGAGYQTRTLTGEYEISRTPAVPNTKTQANCPYTAPRTPAPTASEPYPFNSSTGQATYAVQEWNGPSAKCTTYTRTMGPKWTYRQASLDVAKYVTGAVVQDPTSVLAADTSRWEGCIEERQTEAGTSSFTSNSYDLDPARIPDSAATTRWKPMWADATWARNNFGNTASQVTDGENGAPYNLGMDYLRSRGFYSCGKPAHRLSTMSAGDIANYVDAVDFKPLGGTYHDTGMIWGVRMLASNGIFAADNTGRTGQPVPKKVLVFLTDGDMAPNQNIYGLYGIEYYDRRVSNGTFASLKDYHNARFIYECNRARDQGIDVWTVAIGLDSSDELTQCAANPGQALATTSGSGLSTLFQKIAKQVAMLRIEL